MTYAYAGYYQDKDNMKVHPTTEIILWVKDLLAERVSDSNGQHLTKAEFRKELRGFLNQYKTDSEIRTIRQEIREKEKKDARRNK